MDEQANLGRLFSAWFLTVRHIDLYQLFCDMHYAKEQIGGLEAIADAARAFRDANDQEESDVAWDVLCDALDVLDALREGIQGNR